MENINVALILYIWKTMKQTKYSLYGLVVLILVGFITISSCSKDKSNTNTTPVDTTTGPTYMERMFEAYVLNEPTHIIYASDTTGLNITPNFQGEIIYLRKETYYQGPLEIYIGSQKYVGTWKSNSDYSTLELNISGRPEFEFFLTPWRFTYKSLNLLKLAPISSPGKKELHIQK